jgi:hypothetical protein
MFPCPRCHQQHDLEALEPSFMRPDAFLKIPLSERALRTIDSKDSCVIHSPKSRENRFFLRVLAPFRMIGLESPISWGIWVEISEQAFVRAEELWDNPHQSKEPPFRGNVANELPGYDDALKVSGQVTLTDPMNIPKFQAMEPSTHPFVLDQRFGVSPNRAAEWIIPIYHPETLREM